MRPAVVSPLTPKALTNSFSMSKFLRVLTRPLTVGRRPPLLLSSSVLLSVFFNQLKPCRFRVPNRPSQTFSFSTNVAPSSVSVSSNSASGCTETPRNAHVSARESMEWVAPSHFCGELFESDVGNRVRLCGWVALHRVHGGLTFLNLRDHTGLVQATTLPDKFPDAHETANELRLEYVIALDGIVRLRPSESVNEKMKTGKIEVAVEHVQVLNAMCAKLPFLVTTADDAKATVNEELRLRYRYLDLRKNPMSSNIALRARVVKLIRRYLEDGMDLRM